MPLSFQVNLSNIRRLLVQASPLQTIVPGDMCQALFTSDFGSFLPFSQLSKAPQGGHKLTVADAATNATRVSAAGVYHLLSNSVRYLFVRFADTTRIIASPDGPTFKVPTITGSPSAMLMSVSKPVFS